MQFKFLEKKPILILFSLLAIFLSVVQLVSYKGPSLLFQNEIERIEQVQRMHDYPPQYYHVANIIENRPESRLYFKLESNFFNIFNLKLLPPITIPFVFIGFFTLVKRNSYYYLFTGLFISVLVLTYIGPNQPSGFYCLYPFLIISIIYGILSILKK